MNRKVIAQLYAGLLLVATFSLLLLDTFRLLFSPILFGGILSMALIPVDKKIKAKKSSFLIVMLLYIAIITFIYTFSIPLITSTRYYITNLPSYIIGVQNRVGITKVLNSIGLLEKIEETIVLTAKEIYKIENVFSIITKLSKLVYIVLLTPVFAYYFLKDRRKLKRDVLYLVPSKYREDLDDLISNVIFDITTYVYGFTFICIISGLFAWVCYLIIDIEQSLFLAFCMLCCGIIPFIGAVVGGIPALVLSVNMGWEVFCFVVILVLIEQIISNILTSKIIDNSVGVHPVFVIMMMFVGVSVFGLKGLIISAPVVIIIKNIGTHVFAFTIKRL